VPLRLPAPEPVVFAHRGAHGPERAENSLSAIERALELAVPGVEIDVCSLRDGTLVVAHDDWIEHGGRRIPLGQLMLADLCRISRSQVLSIETALDPFRDVDTVLCLDWKGAGDVTLLGRSVLRHGLSGRTIVSSTRPAAVAGLKDQYPRLAAGLSLPWHGETLREVDSAADGIVDAVGACGADAVMLHHQLADQEVVATLRELSVAVFLWTAEDRETFESLWHRSPDGIMSDVVEECRRPAV
jgi:glycerophosphoryl diester phosphodiesterase